MSESDFSPLWSNAWRGLGSCPLGCKHHACIILTSCSCFLLPSLELHFSLWLMLNLPIPCESELEHKVKHQPDLSWNSTEACLTVVCKQCEQQMSLDWSTCSEPALVWVEDALSLGLAQKDQAAGRVYVMKQKKTCTSFDDALVWLNCPIFLSKTQCIWYPSQWLCGTALLNFSINGPWCFCLD